MMSVLQTAGPQAAHLLDLWRGALFICSAVFLAILIALAWAIARTTRANRDTAPLSNDARASPWLRRNVAIATAISTVLLIALIFASVFTDRALARISLQDAVHITLTGHQWWWELRYESADESRLFVTANEMHIPVGRPVLMTLQADDVIHSFWMPSLGGKRDLIPGHTTTYTLRADQPGTYRGQCAEFCGLQHAWMVLEVIAEPIDQYEAWSKAQRAGARESNDPQSRRGKELFMHGTCSMCHAIGGTDASAQHAPDLTHVASRRRIAAGTLPNTDDAMAQWIRDPHRFKPGTNMPAHDLPPADIQALAAYLRSLD